MRRHTLPMSQHRYSKFHSQTVSVFTVVTPQQCVIHLLICSLQRGINVLEDAQGAQNWAELPSRI